MELTEISDRLTITDLLHTYSARVDAGDVDGVLALFAPDAVLDMGGGRVVSGDSLRPLVTQLVGRWTYTSHHCSTTSFASYDAASAATTTYVEVFHDRPADDLVMLLWGRYSDSWVRTGSTWLIRHRVFRVAGVHQRPSQPLPDRFERFARVLPDSRREP